ncbi:PCYCGC motif-containing (lipo)protein [Solibacillus sp. FSL H8-0538]|uniref:PCYCGC motif-containing (lipo)protein n=1 Tax=Solibacillus sp. FSL H8-0538 TaxID=2921400 RepID=UPI0030FBA263
MRKSVVLVLFLCLVLLVACSNGNEKSNQEEQSENTAINSGDLREETASIEVLPEFLDNKSEEIQNLYMYVAKNKELLEHIPCYCGCGESVGHKNNYDCFIYKNNEDHSLVWDDHATRCGVCLEIATQSINDYNGGKSIKEIRILIDEKYRSGYAEPTSTPKV